MNSLGPPPPALPSTLLKDGWWLLDEVEKPIAVILPFPERTSGRTKPTERPGEIIAHPSHYQADPA